MCREDACASGGAAGGPRAGTCLWEGKAGRESRCTHKIHLPELRAQRLGEVHVELLCSACEVALEPEGA